MKEAVRASCIAFEILEVFSLTLKIFVAVSGMVHIRRTCGYLCFFFRARALLERLFF